MTLKTAQSISRCLLTFCVLAASAGSRSIAALPLDDDKKQAAIVDLLKAGSLWNGRMTFDAKANGKDPRDWYTNLHIMSVDDLKFKGRISMAAYGHEAARDLTVTGEIKGDTVTFKSGRDGSFEISSAEGKLTGKTLDFTWKGTDGRNNARTGKIKITPGKNEDKK